MLRVRVAPADFGPRPETLGRAVARIAFGRSPVNLDELREVDVLAEALPHGAQVGVMPVRRELHPVAQPRSEVLHEVPRAPRIARPDVEGRHELRVRVDGDPRPHGPDEALVLAV